MMLYASGTPKNDRFQAVENQLCSHRLFSMYRDYQSEVFSWLRDIKVGIHSFSDYLAEDTRRMEDCERADGVAAHMLDERGIREVWPGYFETLSAVSAAYPSAYPKHIMLDSGAFTAWNKKARVTLGEVKAAYERFLTESAGLFEQVWLVNLDVIPGENGRRASAEEKQKAIEQSDRNLTELRSEFGDCVLPVFHQGEGKERLLKVVDQGKGYMCLSPSNDKPEEERWRWATLARCALSDLDCNIKTHGLATTGNNMMRNASLYSGDSEAWTRHARYGVVDLIEEERYVAECPSATFSRDEDGALIKTDQHLNVEQRSQLRYKGYHIGGELNDWHKGSRQPVIDNAKHFELLDRQKQAWVRERVERHFPFRFAQFDARARSLINLRELQEFALNKTWNEPSGPTVLATVNGKMVDAAPYAGQNIQTHPQPPAAARTRFMSQQVFEQL